MVHISGSARADTPFGPLAGRTPVVVSGPFDDLVSIEFKCGQTPVVLALSDGNYLKFIRELIQAASAMNKARLTRELSIALTEGAA